MFVASRRSSGTPFRLFGVYGCTSPFSRTICLSNRSFISVSYLIYSYRGEMAQSVGSGGSGRANGGLDYGFSRVISYLLSTGIVKGNGNPRDRGSYISGSVCTMIAV